MSHVVCLMNVEADRATFTWSEGPASFEPYTLDGMVYKDFKEIAAESREKLAALVKDYLSDEQGMPKSAFELAEAGHELYLAMFQPGADQARQAKQVRKWLEQLVQQHEVDTLEIVVESPWSLPWNIIYDQEPDKAAFLSGDDNPDRWKPFWGLRYNLAGGRKVDPLRRMPLLNDPKVLLVVDPEIRDGLPEEQQKRLAEFSESHKFKMVHSKDELQEAVKAERPELLYWLSHAAPDALVLAGEEISPRNMRKLLRQDDDENFGGLAFLNACQTAEGGESGSFFEAFHNVGFAGMIGTEHQTVDQFANPLGLDFLEAFLDRGEAVGSALRKLRGRVPLGLLYGTYCPPDIRVDRGNIRDSLDISQVHVQGVALSAGLAADETATQTLPPLPDEPYRSLAFYDREDRALFAGRDPDIERFATYLDDAATRILVLHGESGVGKSSFLHAGVIPYLEEECLGYRFIRDREEGAAGAQGSVIFIRATNDLYGQLAQALCDFCARPYEYQTPLGEQVSADLPGVLVELIGDDVNQGILRAALRSDPSLLGRIMAAISDRLPFSAILVIDQGEEIFTLAQTPEDQQRGRQALDMLRRTVGAAGNFKVIFCLRTEYYGRVIDRLRRGLHDTGSIREYLLTDFDEDDLLDAICRPTRDERIPYTSEVPFDKYGFRYADGVAEEIAQRVIRYTTQRRDSVLPLMQVICAQLYRLAMNRNDHTVALADLDALGGIQGGMRNHVEGLLGELLKGRPLDKKPVQKLFTQLYLKQPDGTLTTALLAVDEVEKRWSGRMPFGELLDSCVNLRLLKVNTLRIGMEEERRYVSLGHDALAKIAADWDERLSRGARMRKMAAAIAVISSIAIVMAILAVRASIAQKRAEENFNMAREAVDTYFTEVSTGDLENLPGGAGLKVNLLDKAKNFYDKFLEEYATNRGVRRGVAVANYNLGCLDEEVGDFPEAILKLKRAFTIQDELASKISTDELSQEDDIGILAELGNTLYHIGRVRLKTGKAKAAEPELDRALSIWTSVAEANPSNHDSWVNVAEIQMVKAFVDDDLGDVESARDAYQKAQQTRQKLLERVESELNGKADVSDQAKLQFTPAQLEEIWRKVQIGRAEGFFNLAELDSNLWEEEESDDKKQALAKSVLDAAREAVEANHSVLEKKPNMRAQSNLAGSYIMSGKFEFMEDHSAGIRAFEKAKEQLEYLVQWNPGVGQYKETLAWCYRELGSGQEQASEYEKARDSFGKSLELLDGMLDTGGYPLALAKSTALDLLKLESSQSSLDDEPSRARLRSAADDLRKLLDAYPAPDDNEEHKQDDQESWKILEQAEATLKGEPPINATDG